MNRREVLKGAVAGAFTVWAARPVFAQQAEAVRRLTDKLAVIDAGGANVLAFNSGEGLTLVDCGPANTGSQLTAALQSFAPGAKVQTLFNTHYHTDQTGNNEMFASAGAKIVAHERTRQFMAADFWVNDQDRYEKARPVAARPIETFHATKSWKAGSEQVEAGYLLMAHTSGDIYVYFKDSNVIAVGDVASPLRDPALDYFTGAWIGGRVDAMDTVLRIGNDQTRIVPAYGPVMTKAEFKAEREVMEEVRARLFKQVRDGDGPQDMLEGGVLQGLARTWKEPYKFLYDACKGLWAHHDKLDPNVV